MVKLAHEQEIALMCDADERRKEPTIEDLSCGSFIENKNVYVDDEMIGNIDWN